MKKIIYVMPALLAILLSCFDGISGVYDERWGYKLRDRGPAGGWIFYINPNFEVDGWKYLEAAPADITTPATPMWKTSRTATGNTQTGIGTGKANTAAITGAEHPAAQACSDYTIPNGGVIYDDWFLPSKDELYLMCWNLRGKRYFDYPYYIVENNPAVPDAAGSGVGGFVDDIYWSSSEYDQWIAWYQSFHNGYQNANDKDNTHSVRAVRAF